MPAYRELSEPRHSEKADGDWVDFPASPDPDPWGTLLGERKSVAPGDSFDGWNAKRVGSAVVTSLAVVLRGLLVTTAALTIVAYLLLTNSHI